MGGRGASSSGSSGSGSSIKSLQTQYDKLVDKNTKLYKEYNGFSLFKINNEADMQRLNKMNEAHKEWLDNRKKLGVLNTKINIEKDKLAKNKKENTSTNKTFVNGYGEATKRKITNTTYEKAQKKQAKSLMGFM